MAGSAAPAFSTVDAFLTSTNATAIRSADVLLNIIGEFLAARKTGQITLHVKDGCINRLEAWATTNFKASVTL